MQKKADSQHLDEPRVLLGVCDSLDDGAADAKEDSGQRERDDRVRRYGDARSALGQRPLGLQWPNLALAACR